MGRTGNKNNRSKPLTRLFWGALCLLLVFTITPRVKVIWELSEQKQDLLQQKEELTQKNLELEKEKEQAQKPEEIEKIAREQLGMVKQGEKIIVPVVTD